MLTPSRPRISRPAVALLALALPASLALTACGGSDEESFSRLDAVSVSGDPGKAPKLDWKGRMEAKKAVSKVLDKGDGPALKAGETALVDFTLANGYTEKVNYSTYDDDKLAALVPVGKTTEPQVVTDLITAAFAKDVKAGLTVGSRIAVTVNSEELIGQYLGNAQVSQFFAGADVGNEDPLLVIADITGVAGPVGTPEASPEWAPKVVETDGKPTSLDFAGVPAPGKDLKVATIVKGTGPVVASGQQILVNYLGQTDKGGKPFDESFSKGSGFSAVVGGDQANVVEGWSKGLVGLPVGSRVILEIPPALGYKDQAQGEIPANSTLYFVIDILDAADTPPAPEPVQPPPSEPTGEPVPGTEGSPAPTTP